ncbi:MAG: class I SAM-dependent methyltransferase [Proteobacteria bacterium]|nr:class I SAM-dependent methyltransferase [Pseudomonadota bacterium]
MDPIVTADSVKPNYREVRQLWSSLLEKFFSSEGTLDPKFLKVADCPYCHTKDFQGKFSLNGFTHVTCENCESVYVSPRLKDDCLAELYDNEYYSTIYVKSMIPAFEVRKGLIGTRKFNQVTAFSATQGSVLDIGCGIGEVIDVFKDHGWQCDAIEVNPAVVAWLKKLGINVFSSPFEDFRTDKTYDVIMAWGVIEHVVDAKAFLKKVSLHLKPGGVFVSEVPNGQCLLVDYCRTNALDPERIIMGEQHIMLYSPTAYGDLHESVGFKKLKIQTNGLDIETIFKAEGMAASLGTISKLQQCIDDYQRGDLIRGFWQKPV